MLLTASNNPSRWQRHVLGGIAVISLVMGIGLYWLRPEAAGPLAFCWRLGAVAGAAWLAYDDIQRLPAWLALLLPVVLLIILWRPKLLWLLLPLAIIMFVLRRLTAWTTHR